MKKSDQWFEVDRKGLKALQSRKPKTHILRELVQNSWDEDVTEVIIEASKDGRIVTIEVEDNSPIGFRDLKDAYTFFAPCYKRADPTKRGRFNAGEKQAFSMSEKAYIETTKGTIIFDKAGRHTKHKKRYVGTLVGVKVIMNKQEFEEIVDFAYLLIPPKHIKTWFNGEIMTRPTELKEFEVTLPTEYLVDEAFAKTNRKTEVHVFEKGEQAYLYEMGIPVCEINCEYSIDVDQRIPMGLDRDTVSNSYLQDLFAEVLNRMYDDIPEERISESWVRTAMNDTKRMESEAIGGVLDKRFGEKRVVANPKDRLSIDDAIANGYRVIYGSEMGSGEWENTKNNNLMHSSSELFGRGTCDGETVTPNEYMENVANLSKAIAQRILGINIGVTFVDCGSAKTPRATFGDGFLTFYVKQLGNGWFRNALSPKVIGLIIHELGHHGGMHTEIDYHRTLTKLGSELTLIALNEPEVFDEFRMDEK